MNKRYQIFISSTYINLQDERRVVVENILKIDHLPADMELFTAASEEQFSYIKRVIDESDYYVLIIGNRYGSTDESGVSYTEKEYDYAVEKGLPILAFIHNNPELLPANKSELDPIQRERLEAFRNKVRINRLISYWGSLHQLTGEVYALLNRAFNTQPQRGWERASLHNELMPSNPLIEYYFDSTSIGTFCSENFKKARNSILVSSALSSWFSNLPFLLSSVNEQVNVLIAHPDFNNEDVVFTLNQFFGTIDYKWEEQKTSFYRTIKMVKENRIVDVVPIDMFAMTSLVAVDYRTKTEASCIHMLHHLLHEQSSKEFRSYCSVLYPDNVLYERYLHQILLIESMQGKVSKHKRANTTTLENTTVTRKFWTNEINRHISKAKVAVLLVSQAFLVSDFIRNKKLPELLQAAVDEDAWIPVTKSDVSNVILESKRGTQIRISDYQAASDPSKPLDSIPTAERNKVFMNLVQDIRRQFSDSKVSVK